MPQAAAEDWEATTPGAAGFAADLEQRLAQKVEAGGFPQMHGVAVARHGKLFLERYFSGGDQRWGEPLGRVDFGPEVLHDVRSVSKSVVGLLYGIALAEDKVPPLDAPLLDHFPYHDLAADPARRKMTVEHALTMTLGLDWNETLPYSDPRNSEVAMEGAGDRYRYILEHPVAAAPGSRWNYCGGATALLAHLIARGCGKALHDYAVEKIFTPLGITESAWTLGTNGEEAAASGLRLTPRGLAKLGQVMLNQGRWGDRQIVPGAWIADSVTERVPTDGGLCYGYQWWLGRSPQSQKPWWAAIGNGGQRLAVFPHLDLVIAVTAGAYNDWDAWQISVRFMTEVLFPALETP